MDDDDQIWVARVCAHCEGHGCSYCDKKGHVMVRVPAETCRQCDGDGCFVCGYTGWRNVKSKYD